MADDRRVMYDGFNKKSGHSVEWVRIVKEFLNQAFAGCHRVAKCPCIRRAVDAVGTSSRCWILAATTSTLHTSLTPGSGTMDAANVVGTSSRRPADAVGNAVNAMWTSGRRVRYDMYFQQ
jgi:hypothetical protein